MAISCRKCFADVFRNQIFSRKLITAQVEAYTPKFDIGKGRRKELEYLFTKDCGHVSYVVSSIVSPFPNVTYWIRLNTGFVIKWATRRVANVKQDLRTFPEHLRSPVILSVTFFFRHIINYYYIHLIWTFSR